MSERTPNASYSVVFNLLAAMNSQHSLTVGHTEARESKTHVFHSNPEMGPGPNLRKQTTNE